MAKTSIEWTEKTWNPIISGCSIISEGCQNCYAMKMAGRLEAMGQEKYKGLTRKTAKGKTIWNGKINIDLNDKALYEPLKTKKPTMYFVNSMTDLFHESIPFEAIDKIMAVIALCPQHNFQILTKRSERMEDYFVGLQSRQLVSYDLQINKNYFIGRYGPNKETGISELQYRGFDSFDNNQKIVFAGNFPLPHFWLGVSVENQETLSRIDNLRKTPAAVRFLSCEPLLQDLGTIDLKGIHWVICGGESGHGARPMHPDWVRSIRNQCKDANIPFFFKQWGEYLPYGTKTDVLMNQFGETDFSKHQRGNYIGFAKVGKKQAGALLDGKEYREMPKI